MQWSASYISIGATGWAPNSVGPSDSFPNPIPTPPNGIGYPVTGAKTIYNFRGDCFQIPVGNSLIIQLVRYRAGAGTTLATIGFGTTGVQPASGGAIISDSAIIDGDVLQVYYTHNGPPGPGTAGFSATLEVR